MARSRTPRLTALALAMGVGVGAVSAPWVSSPGFAATTSTGVTMSKDVERVFQSEDAQGTVVDDIVDSRTVTVKVDKTEQLRGRERIHISWSGAHPTGGRAVNPYGETGLQQEYPVVILQCRGREGDGLSPETCWTSTRQQRSEVSVFDASEALWRADAYATAAEREVLTGVTPFPDTATCPNVSRMPGVPTHLTPFRAAAGAFCGACDEQSRPPESAVDSSFPPAELAAFTDFTGRGETFFEVRSDVENESLGCSEKVECSVVVIPIMGLSCAPKSASTDSTDRACTRLGKYQPGESFDSDVGYDHALSPRFWWSASNWRNRITIPIAFGPPPNVCELLDSRKPVGFYGSELMSQAGLQWAPAYCLDKTRFKFQANQMPDDAAFDLMGRGDAAAAFVSRARTSKAATVGYAPTAISGFAVTYVIDKPKNTGEYTSLRLTPRLLAKLLTTSYPARIAGRDHPGMANNPLRINLDPEFKALNPGLTDDYETEAAAALMSLSVSSDVMWTLTDYLNRDPEARAFLDGNPDPWGMLVNDAYRGITLPVTDWPLNDTWRLASGLDCEKLNTTPYFTQVAAPVGSLRYIAEAVLDSWPLVQTKAEFVPALGVCKYGRVNRQDIGHRFLLGITDLGDAERLGLRTASLQTNADRRGGAFSDDSGRDFAAPTLDGLAAALEAYAPAGASVPFDFNAAKLKESAYPGTMVVYTAAPLSGMDPTLAKNVAMFIRTATTEGQVLGAGNGQLPDGYLPLLQSGPTAALWKQAQAVATLIEEQKAPDTTGSTPSSSTTDSATPEPTASDAAPAVAGVAESDDGKKDTTQATTFIETDPTAVKTSKIAALLLPLLILGAAICMLATPMLRMMIAQHDHRGSD